jgi:hypothetical protein
MRALASLALALATSVTAVGCSIDLGSSTDGEQGRASFSYSSCFFGCAVDHPVMTGATAGIRIEGKDLPEVDGRATDPSVASVTTEHNFTCCKSTSNTTTCEAAHRGDRCAEGFTLNISQSMNVTGLRAGSTKIHLVDSASKKIIDTLNLEIADAAAVTLKSGETKLEKLEMAVGGGVTLTTEIRDAANRPLETSNGVSLTTMNLEIASFVDPSWIFADPNGVATIEHGNWFSTTTLRGRKTGTTSVQLKAGTFTRTFPVIVK